MLTLANYRYIDIIQLLDFPALEHDLLTGLPLKSYYFLIAILGVLLITITLIYKSKQQP